MGGAKSEIDANHRNGCFLGATCRCQRWRAIGLEKTVGSVGGKSEERRRGGDLWSAQSCLSANLGDFSKKLSRHKVQFCSRQGCRSRATDRRRAARRKISGRFAHGRFVELCRLRSGHPGAAKAAAYLTRGRGRFWLARWQVLFC